ncbi:MAG: dihydrofolate reductase [Proteobacteria bacterium]|nr:dihydrofolate reductase [Pseudomonadota bacterium]
MITPEIVLIVAMAENGAIGRGNDIPWRLKADQQRLKAMTMGKPIVMGRKTFISLRRPLPGRTNIVITRDVNFSAAGAVVTRSLADALVVAKGDALRRLATEIAVIGGAEIYAASMPMANRLEVTEVHAKIDGDTFFPAIDPAIWHETARSRNLAAADDSADYSYVTYRRLAPH